MSEVKWTNEQLNAIKEDRNNVLVAAAAGSGKTAVLVERIINKIINKNVDIDKILVVTFTNAAASEMRERILEAIYKKIEENPNDNRLARQITLLSKSNICTIDSFCLDVVKNNFYEIGISPNFRIADTTELELLKQETIEELFEEKYAENNKDFIQLLETYSGYLSDDNLKELVLNIYNFIQSSPFPNDWLNQRVEMFNLDVKSDFINSEWGKIIVDNLKDNALDCKIRLENILKGLERFEELDKFSRVIRNDINIMDLILKATKWDELYSIVNENTFEKWPVDKKVTLEEKNIAKEKRDKIKKQYTKETEIISCTSEEANADLIYMYDVLKKLKEIVFEFGKKFSNIKAEKNIVDFNDVEHFALNILLKKDENNEYKPTEVAKRYAKKFNEIAIDEYQDSNLVQEYILKSISNGKNMFMVGDVKQSIYKFRQARPELFLHKYKEYKSEEEIEKDNNCKGIKIQLFKNFRSRKNILDTTNIIFENIMSTKLGDIDYNENEYLNLGANFAEIEQEIVADNTKVYVIENKANEDEEILEEPIENIELESKFVAMKIKEIIDSKKLVYDKKEGYRPVTYKDIVILLRATKERANIFEKEISNLGMPVFSDTSAEYLESIEIQTIMSLLKIIDNPMQDIPLVTVLRSYIGEFSDNELIEIRVNTNQHQTFYESMKQYDKNIMLKNKIEMFFEKIKEWQKENEYLDLDELIWKIYEDTGYYNYVGLMPNGLLKQANLKSLFEKAKQYEKASFKGLYNFINFIDRLKTSSGDLSSAKLIGENENVIRIMSIHKSKGLEFPVVFLSGSNKKFNMQDLNSNILLHQDLGIGVNYIDSKRKLQYTTLSKEAIKILSKTELLSEEMRVLYVALTRAKEQLIITGVSKDFEKEIKEKEEMLDLYKEENINRNILKKYKSYLDWIELVSLKKQEKPVIEIEKIEKNSLLNIDEEEKNGKGLKELNKKIKNTKNENLENIIKKLEWKYKDINASKIESKTSVSKIKRKENISYDLVNINTPNFLKEDEKVSSARKGTITHLCLQKLNEKEKYTEEKINQILEGLVLKNIITIKEKETINVTQIYNFTKSTIWKELEQAKLVEKEKTFYINIPANEIYENDVKENILVQGIIDLYYINEKDELILVDYKTDYVKEEKELIEKYKVQLELYKKALEESLNKKVEKIYIYSTQLNKAIEIKY